MLENNLWNWRTAKLRSLRILVGYMNIFVMTEASKTILYFPQDFWPNLVFWAFAFIYHGMFMLFFGKASGMAYFFFFLLCPLPPLNSSLY